MDENKVLKEEEEKKVAGGEASGAGKKSTPRCPFCGCNSVIRITYKESSVPYKCLGCLKEFSL